MKKLLLVAIALLIGIASVQAKVVKITMKDGSTRVLTSSQLSSLDFDEQGNISALTYDGNPIDDLSGQVGQIEIDDEEEELEMISRQVEFGYNDLVLFNRNVKVINFVYPSVDPFGKSITLSGSIIIPENIFNGNCKSEGILLFNHFTVANKDEAPTRGYYQLEGMFLANPLNPNYIIIESDFYGFGVTERFPQAYLYGQINAKATLDCLEPAKRILEARGIDYGPLLFNLGYSSGGFDAMATLKEADMNRPEVKFDKTYAGGGPYDLAAVYRDYVNTDTISYLAAVPLLLVSFNESGNLGLKYSDVFKPLLADNIDEWILSKNYATWDIIDLIGRDKKVSDMLQPAYTNLFSLNALRMLLSLNKQSIATNWLPNTDNQIFLLHSTDDEYVTFQAARNLTDFLTLNGFKKSFIPGKTNLQTNLIIRDQGHIVSMLVWLAQSVAQTKAWPVTHDGGLGEAAYNKFLEKDFTVPSTIALLTYMKVNVGTIVKVVLESYDEEGNFSLIKFMAACNENGLDFIKISRALDDCGIDIDTLIEKVQGLIEAFGGIEGIKNAFGSIQDLIDFFRNLSGNNGNVQKLRAIVNTDLTMEQNPISAYEFEMLMWMIENDMIKF